MLTTIISFLFVLGAIIFIHEFGHYITAKLTDIRVEEFALGFGPKLISTKKGETVYSLRALPLGGFCNMTGEFLPDDDLDEEKQKIYEQAHKRGRCFHQKSVWKRFMVVIMGPLMNFFLALLVFLVVFTVYGIPVDSINTTRLGEVTPELPAAEAGLRPGDKITAVNDQNVDSWSEMSDIIRSAGGEKLVIEYVREEKSETVTLQPEFNEELDYWIIGISAPLKRERVGVFETTGRAVQNTGRLIYATVYGLINMVAERSAEDVGGPVRIASIVGDAARLGFSNLLTWLAILSVNIGLINLLPIPALDGGRLLFMIVEKIRGKPVSPEKEGLVHFIGFIILIILMLLIIYRDILGIL